MGKHGNVTRVTIKASGLAQIRTSNGVMEDLERRARLIADAATANARKTKGLDHNGQEGMAVDSGKGKGKNRRARASVRTATHAAMEAEATDRALTRAIKAGRG